MAQTIISRRGGSTPRETLLWTNPNTGNAINDNTKILLSNPYTDFKYLKIEFQLSTGVPSKKMSVIYAKEEVEKSANANETVSMSICCKGLDSLTWVRRIYKIDNSSLGISIANAYGGDPNPYYLIPTNIYGLK